MTSETMSRSEWSELSAVVRYHTFVNRGPGIKSTGVRVIARLCQRYAIYMYSPQYTPQAGTGDMVLLRVDYEYCLLYYDTYVLLLLYTFVSGTTVLQVVVANYDTLCEQQTADYAICWCTTTTNFTFLLLLIVYLLQ